MKKQVLKLCGALLAVLYAGIMIFAAIYGKSEGVSGVFIVAGSALAIAYSLLAVFWHKKKIFLLIIGMAAISAGTLLNGFLQNNIHVQHHVIRFVVEGIIVAVSTLGG